MSKEVAIVVVAFNDSRLIAKQIECINLFCQDSFEIVIVDNSEVESVSERIKNITEENECVYIRTKSLDKDFSVSHSSACNSAYTQLKNDYDYFLFLDHDNFPIKKFNIKKMLSSYIIGGIPQFRGDKVYFWAGFVMFNNNMVSSEDVDFSINREFGLDTGGNLYKLLNKMSCLDWVYFDEKHIQIPNYTGENNVYALIAGGTFQHNIKSSNWNKSPDHEVRINKLYEVLEQNIKNYKL
jgi:glycosyltransferase involved in cell wall biosynthesis